MADRYTFQNLAQLSHTAGNIAFLYDRANDNYRPLEQQDLSLSNSAGSTSLDAFGRMRVSEPLTLFDSSHRYADNNLWSMASGVSGSGSFNQNQGLIEMNVTNASGSFVTRETKKVFAYQPGKSLLVLNTFVMSPAKTGLTQRVGYFGTDNGMYLELADSTLNFVERSLVDGSPATETRIPQSTWNGDKLDGTGASGITLDITKAQILWMDVEWLGLGSVRMGFIINGQFILCHSFHHANLIDSTYITTACLPLRYEIANTAATSGASKLKQICSSVISEGGYELRGSQQSIGTSITGAKTLTTAGNLYPLVSLRLKSDKLDAIVIPSAASAITIDTSICEWRLIEGGTTIGGSWGSVNSDSSVQYNIDGTGISGGVTVAKGFISSSNQSSSQIHLPKGELFKFQLERNSFTNTPSEFILAISASTDNETAYGSLDWEEISR